MISWILESFSPLGEKGFTAERQDHPVLDQPNFNTFPPSQVNKICYTASLQPPTRRFGRKFEIRPFLPQKKQWNFAFFAVFLGTWVRRDPIIVAQRYSVYRFFIYFFKVFCNKIWDSSISPLRKRVEFFHFLLLFRYIDSTFRIVVAQLYLVYSFFISFFKVFCNKIWDSSNFPLGKNN